MKRHVLITGGAGFIGSHLSDVLLARGFEVTVIDCLCPELHPGGWPAYLDPGIRRVRGDIRDADVFEAALAGVTHLAHLASPVQASGPGDNAAAVMLDVLARRRHDVRRIVLASSMEVYGEGHYGPTSDGRYVSPPGRTQAQLNTRGWELVLDGETLTPKPTPEEKPSRPTSAQGLAKRDEEGMFLAGGRALAIPTVALRVSHAYGPRLALGHPQRGVAAAFIARLLNDRAPFVFEDGAQRRDFIHVLDVAHAFAAVLESEAPMWEACNLGSGRPVAVLEMAQALTRLLGKSLAPEVIGRSRADDVRHRFADIAKIERLFGFTPSWDLDIGLRELIGWARSVDREKVAMDGRSH